MKVDARSDLWRVGETGYHSVYDCYDFVYRIGIVCSNWARFRSLRQRFCRLNIERMDFISSKVFAKGFGFCVERDVAATCAQVRVWFEDLWVEGEVGEKDCCVWKGVEYFGSGRGFGVD